MIAIWPAGPPKLMQPSFSQNQNASASPGFVAAWVPLVPAARSMAASELMSLPHRQDDSGSEALEP